MKIIKKIILFIVFNFSLVGFSQTKFKVTAEVDNSIYMYYTQIGYISNNASFNQIVSQNNAVMGQTGASGCLA